ncbi:MAG: hypothetical protein HS115_01120 [Spirochaetales bacterium]|nr:hypothetical protein [Spirochaetales bacterium]
MLLAILYTGAGIYLLAIRWNWIHRQFARSMARSQKHGLTALALGLLVLGLYTSWFQYFSRTEEGRAFLELQRATGVPAQPEGAKNPEYRLPTGR